jgi:hypothetical protein
VSAAARTSLSGPTDQSQEPVLKGIEGAWQLFAVTRA